MKSKYVLLACTCGLGLTLALCLLLALDTAPPTAHAWPATPIPGGTRPPGPAFVKAGGTGGWCLQNDPCGSIQYAIDQCEPGNGDTIYVGEGVYTSTEAHVIKITKSITLHGGWDGAGTGSVVRDPISYATILDGENGRRVVYITGTIAPILDGLALQRGDATGLGGDPTMPTTDFGGAVYANNASPVITNCRIVSSAAGFGGGLALFYGTPTVGNSVVLSNTASQDIGGGTIRGGGGGIFLYHSPATIAGNIVMNNVASGTYTLPLDGGGGLYLDSSAAMIRDNTIQGNTIYGPYARGGGLYLFQSNATVRNNVIQDNNAPTSFGGGATIALSAVDFSANMVLNNSAQQIGGGLEINCSAPFTMTNNIVALNQAGGYAPALFASGCVWPGNYPTQGTLLHNTFVENYAPSPSPWMIGVGAPGGPMATLAFTNTIIDKPGGILVDAAGAAILDTTLWGPSLLLAPGLTVTGTGTVISRTNYYSETDLTRPSFHLGRGSAAIDLAADAGIATDIDGDTRPIGDQPDIGADEWCFQVYLPLVLRNW